MRNTRTIEQPHSKFVLPNLWDIFAMSLVVLMISTLGWGASHMATPYQLGDPTIISLDPHQLPYYGLRSVLRMFIALFFSLLATFSLGALAAKKPWAERLIIPLIDVLQSVPVLGFLSMSLWGFVALFPNSMLGPESAAIFAVFTSQAWNMILSFYQSLKTLPSDLQEATTLFQLSAWQRFWRLEVPFALPSLLWNTMISLSAGWFFVVASEAISVAHQKILLPGIGSYIAVAVEQGNMHAIGYALIAMLGIILAYDQIVFRPAMLWANKFHMHADNEAPTSWVAWLYHRTRILSFCGRAFGRLLDRLINFSWKVKRPYKQSSSTSEHSALIDHSSFWIVLLGMAGLAILTVWFFLPGHISWQEVLHVCFLGAVTAVRIGLMIVICLLLWVPIGVWIGLRPRIASILQPIIQFLAAFPANLLFPFVIMLIIKHGLNVEIWTSPLIILGTQWYILFNVIAGTMSLPKRLKQAVCLFQVKRWLWWKKLVLPGIFPHLLTGIIAAVGGAWNTSIIAEALNWNDIQIRATGLGAYITDSTLSGDFAHLALGILMMCAYVLVINHCLWQPLYQKASQKYRME